MGLKEFRDSDGRSWRVWDITAEKLHPSTRAEDYLQGFLEGWLVFEALEGGGRARLYPIPQGWEGLDDDGLMELLARADQVRDSERRSGPKAVAHDSSPVHQEEASPSSSEHASEVRTFKYPGGRYWTVAEWPMAPAVARERPSERVVLRFASGARALDLMAWPRDWTRYSDRELADLLWSGFPRQPTSAAQRSSEHRRRRDDTGDGAAHGERSASS